MQCRECGQSIATPSLFCPACGARLVAVDPQAHAQSGVAAVSHVPGADVTQAQPIIPAAVRGQRPAPAPLHQAPVAHLGVPGTAMPIAVPRPAVVVAASAPASPAKPVLPQPGDVLGDRYRIEKFLGQGSLTNAYLCRDLKASNREVVVKAMHARKSLEPGLADSFIYLAESVAKYDHRGIAKIFEAGRLGETPYYAMEWVSGVPMRMWLMERLTFENRVLPGLGLIRSLIDTLEAIHERGCYGCLKPENIFIGLSGPVVMDFGVVGFLTPQEFEFNSYARRYLPYMAPELRQDWSNLLPHSDYYSLGAILYEILAGRAPSAPLRLPSELSDLFGIEADEIILKAMAPKPLDRFGTLEAFRLAVESLQAVLLGSQAPQPGSEGSRSMLAATSDAITIHNPDETFAGPVASGPLQDPSFLSSAVLTPPEANPWSRDTGASDPGFASSGFVGSGHTGPGPVPPIPPGPLPSDEDPSETMEAAPFTAPSSFATPPLGGSAENAHAQRRFTHSPRGAFPEGELPSPNALLGADGQPLAAGAWEGPAGTAPDGSDVPAEEAAPVPAWLWISIALAGCCMVVLSAYFGLLLPKF